MGNLRVAVAVLGAMSFAWAQDVGMGARAGSSQRFEAPYRLEIETPHVKWAKPLAGGPVRLLAVPTVGEGRTLVELAQRLSLDLTTVSIDPDWDVNKWTMAFGKDYGARAEKGDLKLIYSYLDRELTSSKRFDAILLPLHHGWEQLSSQAREALERRVREGCGLVLIRPFANELSPLIPTGLKPENGELMEPAEPGPVETSPWRRAADHYITRAVPVESFPFHSLQTLIYRAEPGASVLISTESGHPVLAMKTHGKGRVVAFGYRNAGMSWHMPMEARGRFVDPYWEYFYALLCRSILYAAGREPAETTDWARASSTWRIKDAQGRLESSGRGPRPDTSKLRPGRHFLEQQTAADWNVAVIDIPQPDRVENLACGAEVLSEGQTVDARWTASRPAVAEVIDGLGRVIARETGSGTARLRLGRPLTHSGFLRVTAGTAVEQIPLRFAASSREWDDYEVVMPWYGPRTYQPWIPAVDEQFRRIGITTLAGPERNFKFMVSAHLPGFGIYWYNRDGYLKRKAEYARTGDKRHLVREVEFQSPAFEAGLRAQLEKSLKPVAPLKPMAVYLADESSVTFYADSFDLSFASEALAGFRTWLREEYGGLKALNQSWQTSFADWESVVPMTAAEAQKHSSFAPWADHRAYMERAFIEAFSKARALVHEFDPGGRASISGTQVPTPHNGANWYEIDQRIDYLQPYSGGNQDPMHHLFRPGLPITGFTGYGLVGDEVQREVWERLFYGHRGASIFWQYTLLNPDLTFSEQGKALAEAFGRMQSGIARVFINSTVREDGVAIHFSMASMRGAWITDGKIAPELGDADNTSANFAELMKRRDAWTKSLERQGVQFRFLATPQIEAGALEKYKVLILPYSIAITAKEAREIERFLDRGGVVYGDDRTGLMDERCRWSKAPLWTAGRPGFRISGPTDLGIRQPAAPESLTTIRDFGRAKLTGILPARPVVVRAPEGAYDLLRGGPAAERVTATPAMPAYFLEMPARFAKLELDGQLNVRLTDRAGAPVDLSVVRLEVFDPAGALVRHYSGNVTVRGGRAAYAIPFALSDAPGTWKVRARDVVSGLTAETSVRRPH